MLEKMDYNIFVNDENKDLVNDINNAGYKIELYRDIINKGSLNTNLWECKLQGDTFIISFETGNESIDYFTHEILHAYFISSKNFTNTADFYNNLQVNSFIGLLLNLSLIGHINNVFAHEKFYPIYINKQFSKDNFTCDFNVLPVFYRSEIEDCFNKKDVPNHGVMYFISTYFSCVDCRSGLYNREIESHFNFLQGIDLELFQILSSTWERWIMENNISNNKEIISSLITDISNWYRPQSKTDVISEL